MLVNNYQKGYFYEINVKNYIINNLNKQAFLWSEIPETILVEHGIIGSHNDHRLIRKENKLNPLRDIGIDILQIESDGKISFVQCKNGYSKGIIFDDLAGFSLMTLHHYKLIKKSYVYYTNKLSNNILSLPQSKKIKYIKKKFDDLVNSHNIITKNKINSTNKIIPFDYQTDAQNKLIKHFTAETILNDTIKTKLY